MNTELKNFLTEYSAMHAYELAQLRDVFSKNSQPVKGALALPIGDADRALTVLANSAGRLMGWAIANSSTSDTAAVDLLDGTTTDGDILAPIRLTAGESVRDWFGPAGVSFGRGLFADITSGAVTGTVWLGRFDA